MSGLHRPEPDQFLVLHIEDQFGLLGQHDSVGQLGQRGTEISLGRPANPLLSPHPPRGSLLVLPLQVDLDLLSGRRLEVSNQFPRRDLLVVTHRGPLAGPQCQQSGMHDRCAGVDCQDRLVFLGPFQAAKHLENPVTGTDTGLEQQPLPGPIQQHRPLGVQRHGLGRSFRCRRLTGLARLAWFGRPHHHGHSGHRHPEQTHQPTVHLSLSSSLRRAPAPPRQSGQSITPVATVARGPLSAGQLVEPPNQVCNELLARRLELQRVSSLVVLQQPLLR